MKVSQAQIKASKKWDSNNRERKNYIVKRSTAKSFIKNNATLEDLQELTMLINDRIELLNSEDNECKK